MSKLFAAIWGFARSSLLWGSLAAAGFFVLIHRHVLPYSDLMLRYTTREWVQWVETVFFFIGLTELILKAFEVADQRSRMNGQSLAVVAPLDDIPGGNAPALLERLAVRPSRERHGFYPRRLREALEFIALQGSANAIQDELKYLSSLDAARSHAGFAFTRIVIWAIPIWGFLGTVLGITSAISSLDPKTMEHSLGNVTSSLGGVFDTTALALMFSIGLMFVQYFVDRFEGSLLNEVDSRVASELTTRFDIQKRDGDPQMDLFQRTAEAMIQTAEQMVDRRIESALGQALERSVEAHAAQLAAVEKDAAKRNRRHWSRVNRQLVDCTQALQSQGNVLLQVVEALGQVTQLEDALNRNLSALGGARHFQETQMNLLAAVNLLNARLSEMAPPKPRVSLPLHARGEAA